MALDPAPELPEREKIRVRDRSRRLVHRVEDWRGVTLREDESIVVEATRVLPIVVEVVREQDSDEVRGRHARGRMSGPGGGGRSDAVRAELGGESNPTVRRRSHFGFS